MKVVVYYPVGKWQRNLAIALLTTYNNYLISYEELVEICSNIPDFSVGTAKD